MAVGSFEWMLVGTILNGSKSTVKFNNSMHSSERAAYKVLPSSVCMHWCGRWIQEESEASAHMLTSSEGKHKQTFSYITAIELYHPRWRAIYSGHFKSRISTKKVSQDFYRVSKNFWSWTFLHNGSEINFLSAKDRKSVARQIARLVYRHRYRR